MTDALAAARYELALANRIIAMEGVLDAFGHVSLRHPEDPSRYLLSRSRAPELVEPSDIYEYTLDSKPLVEPEGRQYGERVIHGCLFDARSDVMAVCHHHSAAFMPFCVTGQELVPVYHQGAIMGQKVPFWDSRDEFGSTNQMVVTPEEGRSHARALGEHWMVLLRRHGTTVVGRTLKETVFRTVYSARNAEYQTMAMAVGGPVDRLNPEEIQRSYDLHASPNAHIRSWEYWVKRLERDGRLPEPA